MDMGIPRVQARITLQLGMSPTHRSDDTRTMINPDAPETCNGVDDDCNTIDDGLLGTQPECFAPSCLEVLRDHLPAGSETLWVGSDEGSARRYCVIW